MTEKEPDDSACEAEEEEDQLKLCLDEQIRDRLTPRLFAVEEALSGERDGKFDEASALQNLYKSERS